LIFQTCNITIVWNFRNLWKARFRVHCTNVAQFMLEVIWDEKKRMLIAVLIYIGSYMSCHLILPFIKRVK